MKDIIFDPNQVLRSKCEDVKKGEFEKIRKIISDLKDTLQNTKNGIGLAANQIGYTKKIFYIKLDDFEKIFINPEITNKSKEQVLLEEGCLSVPNKVGQIARFKKVIVKAYNEDGNKFKLKTKGLLAQVIQHEIDHLDGKLYIDKAISISSSKENLD